MTDQATTSQAEEAFVSMLNGAHLPEAEKLLELFSQLEPVPVDSRTVRSSHRSISAWLVCASFLFGVLPAPGWCTTSSPGSDYFRKLDDDTLVAMIDMKGKPIDIGFFMLRD